MFLRASWILSTLLWHFTHWKYHLTLKRIGWRCLKNAMWSIWPIPCEAKPKGLPCWPPGIKTWEPSLAHPTTQEPPLGRFQKPNTVFFEEKVIKTIQSFLDLFGHLLIPVFWGAPVCVFAHCGGNEITFRACPQLKHICCNDVPSSWCFLQKVSEDARSESWFKLSQFSQPEGVSEFWSPGPDYPCWRWHGPIPSLANTTSCRQWEQHGKATW